MTWLNRLSTSMFAHIERLVAPIENHDAVVEAAVREARNTVARSKVRLGRLQRESTQLNAQLTTLTEDAQRWVKRARELADQNQDAALECLKRRRGCEARAKVLSEAISTQEETSTRLAGCGWRISKY